MELKGRLLLIAKMIPSCNILSDVGTDHAYIPIYLSNMGICKKAIACDVRTGPLKKAKINIEAYGFSNLIETRLGSGLKPINLDEIDVVVIAGMGGILIKDILSEDIEKAKKASRLILQPMNAIEVLREWLYKNGFCIFDETLTQEEEKIYNVVAAKWTGHYRDYKEADHYIGEKLVEKQDMLLDELIRRNLKQLDKAINGLNRAVYKDIKAINDKIRLRDEINKIRRFKNDYES